MPLNAEQKKRMDKLDFSMGGGYSDFLTDVNKAAPSDSKFLFIGLGGKGSSVVAGLKTEVYKRIQCPNNKYKPDNFEYLAIDTSTDELKILERGSFGQIKLEKRDSETFELYDTDFAQNLKDGIEGQPEYIKEWINPTLTPDIVGNGAGGNRQSGRSLLFSVKFDDLKNVLESKLTRLNSLIKNSTREKLIVYIFAGIGGGTGSGTIIDIPYIVREIVKRKQWSANVYGYVFLPDTYSHSVDVEHTRINSYAALQEIDALMSLKDCKGRFKATYGSMYSIESDKAIFDSCVLVSGKRGTGLVPEPDKFTRRVVIDNIINLVSNTSTNGNMLANSFLDNNPVQIRNKVMALNETVPKNKFFQYLAIGIGAVELPMDQMMAYLAKGTFDKMRVGWNQHANENDVEQELKNLYTEPKVLGGKILDKSTTPLFSYSKGLMAALSSFKKIECIQNGTFFAEVQNLWMAHNVEMFPQWKKYRQICIAEVITTFDDRYKEMFQNPKYGIYYLKELLSWRVIDNQSFNGIRECINADYYAAMNELINGAKKAEGGARRKRLNLEKKGAFFFPYEEYCKTCVEELVLQDIQTLYDQYVRKCLDELILNIEEKIKDLQAYVDIFTYLEEIVYNNYNTAMKGNMPHAEYTNVLLDFAKKDDDASVKKIIEMLDEQLAQKTAAGLVTALEGKILATETAWLHSEDEFNPVKVFVEFLESQFDRMAGYTLDSFLQLKYNAGELGEAVNNMCDDLQNSASVLFPAKLPLSNLPHNNYIVIPASGAVSDIH